MSRVNEPDHSPTQPPGGKAGDQGVVFVINGTGATVYYGPQQASNGGTNVTTGGAASGPVAVSGQGGSATGGQSMQAEPQAGGAAIKGDLAKEGWWARLRKRGMIVAFATIVGAIAAVIGTVIAVCVWTGWSP